MVVFPSKTAVAPRHDGPSCVYRFFGLVMSFPESAAALEASGPKADVEASEGKPRKTVVSSADERESSSFRSVLTEVWEARDLLIQLTQRDIRIRYKQAVMGFAWALLMPVLVVFAGAVVRLVMAQVAGIPLDRADIGGVAIKAVPWGFFVGSLGFAVNSLVSNVNLVTKIYFPREILPLSSVLAQAFDSAIACVALIVVLPFLGAKFTWALLWIPVLIGLVGTFTLGLGMLLACANLLFRDVKYIVQILLTFGVFFTPVFFEPALLGARGAAIIAFNPLTAPFEGLRLAVFEGASLQSSISTVLRTGETVWVWRPWWLIASGAISVALLLVSAKVFRRLQFVFAERI